MKTPTNNGNLVSDAEFIMTSRDFAKIASIMHRDTGIALLESKANLVYSRLAKRLRLLGLKSFEEYCHLIEQQSGTNGNERDAMIAALTTNVTRFFREPHHFEHLTKNIVPYMVTEAKLGKAVRIWSAACSSGQEPYSIALSILSVFPEANQYDLKILATDIDPNMIAHGIEAVYDSETVQAIPTHLRQRYFSTAPKSSGSMVASAELRGLVTFRKLNLIGDWPIHGKFHAIFCRNVVIYFDQATQNKLWARMVPMLTPGGVLYIGHSERVAGPAEALLRSDGVTTYRPVSAKAAS
ncbi:MAG: chemotaxis protein [Acidocella sp. 20-57-95]|nr:MAG: chemotaxis protein [Acidocella sp. 20-57-95]HQT63333.1 protein-glutamate O-methyltransferase CheR [Acidocella sp.]